MKLSSLTHIDSQREYSLEEAMCGRKGYSFSAVLVRFGHLVSDRVYGFCSLVLN